jgi:hypothetical protein
MVIVVEMVPLILAAWRPQAMKTRRKKHRRLVIALGIGIVFLDGARSLDVAHPYSPRYRELTVETVIGSEFLLEF